MWFNEFDPYCAQWLRNLYPQATIDDRPIQLLSPADPVGHRCHFFAGIAGWDYALDLAGWPEGREVWTGSCPCQPFSAAGKGKGAADPRHLWPDWFNLIRVRHPQCILGEQVASSIGHGWLDTVFADLEAEGYTCGAAVLGAHSVGAPHIRQRLYWVAHTPSERPTGLGLLLRPEETRRYTGDLPQTAGGRWTGGLAKPQSAELPRLWPLPGGEQGGPPDDGRLGHPHHPRLEGRCLGPHQHPDQLTPWAASVLIPCADGKARPAQPGIFPLAHGFPRSRVGILRAAGDALGPQTAAAFIKAFLHA